MTDEPATPLALRIINLGYSLHDAACLSEIILVGFVIVYT
jgi:hypothetical protein